MNCRPNVLLIAVDQWRGDCLSIAGHSIVRTPTLDSLATHGARFSHAYSATPTCIPARTSLMTGLAQENHRRVGYRDGVAFDYPVTLASEFRRHGYQTRALGKLHVWPERARIGFDEVTLSDGYIPYSRKRARAYELFDDYLPWLRHRTSDPICDDVVQGLGHADISARPWDRDESLHPTNWIVSKAIAELYRRDGTAPFFWYLSFLRPHPPYDPPRWAFERFLNAPPYEPTVGDWASLYDDWRSATPAQDDYAAWVDPELLHRARAGYYGHMSHIDAQLNRFFEALAEFGLAEDTIVAFVSDHGEMLGEHGLFRKGFPYQGSVHVPFLLAGPEGGPIPTGVVCDEPVELRDVMPTLLDCAGLPLPSGLDGRSVLPLIQDRDVQWREYLHGEHTLLAQSMQWLTDGSEKYVWLSGSGREQLFDLVADPHESRDLSAVTGHAGTLHHWRARMVEVLRGRDEGFVEGEHLVPGRAVQDLLTRPAPWKPL